MDKIDDTDWLWDYVDSLEEEVRFLREENEELREQLNERSKNDVPDFLP